VSYSESKNSTYIEIFFIILLIDALFFSSIVLNFFMLKRDFIFLYKILRFIDFLLSKSGLFSMFFFASDTIIPVFREP